MKLSLSGKIIALVLFTVLVVGGVTLLVRLLFLFERI